MQTNLFKHSFNIAFHQVDQGGVMFYAHLFTHAHDAYAALMSACSFGLPEVLAEDRYTIPIVRAEADYYQPLQYGDKVLVQLSVEQLGNSSMTFKYDFLVDDHLSASASTTHVFLSNTNRKSVSLPEPLVQQLRSFMASEQ